MRAHLVWHGLEGILLIQEQSFVGDDIVRSVEVTFIQHILVAGDVVVTEHIHLVVV